MDEDTCCVCGHLLKSHLIEKGGWRCHTLGPDAYQCECFLRIGRYDEGLEGYGLEKRVKQHRLELEQDRKNMEAILNDEKGRSNL